MTQYFTYRNFSLSTAPLHTRVLMTAFSVVVLVALAVGVINYWDKTGMTPAGVVAWYRGNEGASLAPGAAMTFEKTFRELLDAAHPHLFGQGVLLFILSHILALTRLGQKAKITIYLVSFGAMLFDAAVPWLIRYVSPDLAPLQLASVTLLTGSFLAQLWFPAREMWFDRRREEEEPVSVFDRSRRSGAGSDAPRRPRSGPDRPPRVREARVEAGRSGGRADRRPAVMAVSTTSSAAPPRAGEGGDAAPARRDGRRRRSRWRRGRRDRAADGRPESTNGHGPAGGSPGVATNREPVAPAERDGAPSRLESSPTERSF